MKNTQALKSIIVLGTILLLLDAIYLSLFQKYFQKQIYQVQNKPLKMDWNSAILCYIVLILGLYYFIVREKKSPYDAFLLGLFVYGVYELTSKGLLADWQWSTVALDTVWGGILFMSAVYLFQKVQN
jgi:uncharacterized membrane protein